MADKESFEDDWNLNSMLQNLKNTDAIYTTLKNKFALNINKTILDYYGGSVFSNELLEEVEMFSTSIINLTETVIDKDKNYTEERFLEDYEGITKAVSKMNPDPTGISFRATLLGQSKEMMVENFEEIFDLSSTGFRLLEKEASWYIMLFEISLNEIIKKNRITIR